jgi:16S rRNA (adenine1518-N6/adenine1519-N6)-dimethyltransferase
MSTPRKVLEKYGIRPVRSLGQSFLIDRNVTTKIVENSGIEKTDTVVEIGAGPGIMTRLIAEKAGKVIALEIDPKIVDALHKELGGTSNLEIVRCDVLKYDFTSVLDDTSAKKIKVIGNIPYNISSQILFRLIESRDMISSMTLMFQKEVADRIIAAPGGKEYGILSVITAMYALPTKVMTVSASCFYPKPKVDSTVVRMDVRQKPLYETCDSGLFSKIVRASFSKRRKTLVNSLKASDYIQSIGINLDSILESIGIDGGRRGETLTVEEFGRLSEAVETAIHR